MYYKKIITYYNNTEILYNNDINNKVIIAEFII